MSTITTADPDFLTIVPDMAADNEYNVFVVFP
jgi:hypothetical protein